jgi:hypothetical protein
MAAAADPIQSGPLSEACASGVEPIRAAISRVLDGVFNTLNKMPTLREAVLRVATKNIEDAMVLEKLDEAAKQIHTLFGRQIAWYDENVAERDLAICETFAQQFLDGNLEEIKIGIKLYPHPYKNVSKEIALQYKLTRDEIAAIRLYTLNCDFFRWLNFYLRWDDRDLARIFFPFVRLLMTALAKLPKFEGPLLFRGMKQDCSNKFPLEQQYQNWFFESFSTNFKVAVNFAGADQTPRTLLTLDCRGFSGATNITWFSRYPFEDEVLSSSDPF